MNKCIKCGRCCRETTVAIDDNDIKDIYNKTKKSNFYLTRKTGAKIVYWKKHKNTHYCVFYDIEQKCCSIYDVRPKVCRNYHCFLDKTIKL